MSPIVCSGYRNAGQTGKLFNRKVLSFVKAGHTKEESYNLARQTISIPGSGEHCLGLAVDFYTRRYHKLEAFEDTPESKWLVEHARITVLSCGMGRIRRILPESSMSPGITAMWGWKRQNI